MKDELQSEVAEWSRENFGDQPPENPFLGAGEEAGELATSVLKRAQGIDDSEKYADRDDVGEEAERDAVGDITIYMMDGLARLNEDDHSDNGAVLALLSFFAQFGDLCDQIRFERMVGDNDNAVTEGVGSCQRLLRHFCDVRGYDYEECVADAWEEVSGREWEADTDD